MVTRDSSRRTCAAGRPRGAWLVPALAACLALGACHSAPAPAEPESETLHTVPTGERPGPEQRAAAPPEQAPAPAPVQPPAAHPSPPPPGRDFGSTRVTLANGLIIDDLRAGDGDVCLPDSRVIVRYAGHLPDGSVFDRSPPDAPRVFELRRMIRGWRDGLLGMRTGGVRRLTIPPDLAYGAEGYPRLGVPPDATLVYDIELAGLGVPHK